MKIEDKNLNFEDMKKSIELEKDIHKISKLLNRNAKFSKEYLYPLVNSLDLKNLKNKIENENNLWKINRCIHSINEINKDFAERLVNSLDLKKLKDKIKYEKNLYKIGICIQTIGFVNKEVAKKLIPYLKEKIEDIDRNDELMDISSILLDKKVKLTYTFPFAELNEENCRNCFEEIFNEKFPKKSNVTWLVNSSGNLMELDGYCKKLKIAFEYHGIQHYKYVKHFHNESSFEKRMKDDELKRKLCKQRGITLIEIPYTVKKRELRDYIIQECIKYGKKIPRYDKNKTPILIQTNIN